MDHPNTSNQGSSEAVRGAYSKLSEGEKAKISRFTAQNRFTNELFEEWLRQSGLQGEAFGRNVIADRQYAVVRQRLDAALLQNETLMRDLIVKFLSENDGVLQRIVAHVRKSAPEAVQEGRVAEGLRGILASQAPEDVKQDPQFELVRAVLDGGWLDEQLNETFRPGSVHASVQVEDAEALGQLPMQDKITKLQGSCDVISGKISLMRCASEETDIDEVVRQLGQASALVKMIHMEIRRHGLEPEEWQSPDELRAFVSALPSLVHVWAKGMYRYLSSHEVKHRLSRRRELLEETRQRSLDELARFAMKDGVSANLPGPFEDVQAWWVWAAGLDDANFKQVETYCEEQGIPSMLELLIENPEFEEVAFVPGGPQPMTMTQRVSVRSLPVTAQDLTGRVEFAPSALPVQQQPQPAPQQPQPGFLPQSQMPAQPVQQAPVRPLTQPAAPAYQAAGNPMQSHQIRPQTAPVAPVQSLQQTQPVRLNPGMNVQQTVPVQNFAPVNPTPVSTNHFAQTQPVRAMPQVQQPQPQPQPAAFHPTPIPQQAAAPVQQIISPIRQQPVIAPQQPQPQPAPQPGHDAAVMATLQSVMGQMGASAHTPAPVPASSPAPDDQNMLDRMGVVPSSSWQIKPPAADPFSSMGASVSPGMGQDWSTEGAEPPVDASGDAPHPDDSSHTKGTFRKFVS